MTMLSKSRYTATRGAPGSVTVPSYHLAPAKGAERERRNLTCGLARISARMYPLYGP
jgi:hypothetical protein